MGRKPNNPSSHSSSNGEEEFPFGANVEPATADESGAVPAPPGRLPPDNPDPGQQGEPGPEAPEVRAEPSSAPDPYDPSTYKVTLSLAAAAGVQKHLTELAVTPPKKAWWVRRHPDPAYALTAWVIDLKEEQETYLVLPPLWPSLQGEATFRPKVFYLSVTMQGKYFLWPVRVPADDTREPDRWMRTPLEAVRLAKDQWTRITWNEESRQHDVATSAAPQEPEWPDLSFRELLKLAFQDRVIDSLDHPVLRKLRGESQ
jgi:hypothetical protein